MNIVDVRETLLAQFDGDTEFMQEMVDLFLARSAEIQVDLSVAVKNQDLAQVVTLAHELKGMALNLSQNQIGAAARALEFAARAEESCEGLFSELQHCIQQESEVLQSLL